MSQATLSKWMKLLMIPTRGRAEIKMIGNVNHRRCHGPLHQGEWVPIANFHKNAGKALGTSPRCNDCRGVNQRQNFSRYKPWVESIYRRLGYSETRRRLGIAERTLTIWLGKDPGRQPPETIHKRNAIKIIQVMGELRITGEVRHRKSIRRGSAVRGEIERPVSRPADLLVRHGDNDTEYKRKFRAENPDYGERQNGARKARRLRQDEAA